MEEVSAFANTFGGYIFIGVNDKNEIEGCEKWDEQKIHTTIHDSITPIPPFDVKKFTIDEKIVYVIKIDEGPEPPYIINTGKIYERLSSGSFPIKDSVRLSQVYLKREQLLNRIEKILSIPPMEDKVNNIYGYIDMGFYLMLTDREKAFDVFNNLNLKEISLKLKNEGYKFNLTRVGNSIIYCPTVISNNNGHLIAHVNNFIEIMADGNAKMRILLFNNNHKDSTVNMIYPFQLLESFKEIYLNVMGEIFPNQMIYAKKYESLTVLKQFNPTIYFDEEQLEVYPMLHDRNRKILDAFSKHQEVFGTDVIISDNRIPKYGFYTIDKKNMDSWGVEYNKETIIDELFYSSFVRIGTHSLAELE